MPDPALPPKKRGPNTPEGKARSSMNALKHGLRAKRFLILPEEDSAEFLSFAADIRSTYRPKDAVEAGHVEAIAVAMWREIRADRVEGENMARNAPAGPGQSHGTDLVHAHDRASLTTALRYRSQAQMELKRATDLFWRHRKARLAGLLDEAEEEQEITAAADPLAPCTNEFPADPAPLAAASEPAPPPAAICTNEFPPPDRRPAASRTNEFRAPAPPPPGGPDGYTLLSTYRALKKESVGKAWAWLNDLPPELMEQVVAVVANEGRPPPSAGRRAGGTGSTPGSVRRQDDAEPVLLALVPKDTTGAAQPS